ncbi:hypothetical protein Trco_005320 [Trichoderma cornu-damae]|uniref:Uncharacterized protein n=1 Tax=Trichoderma cornu-damae TaxID=654480 RepID=A0A9P8QPA8_9HYPO|nr:hypothetical protein Trco_005320 [Trichoderma cornu-damae]
MASTAATSASAMSRAESSAWSSVSRASGTMSGAASLAAATSGYYRHEDNHGQQQHYPQHVMGSVPPAGRPPFWWMGASASDLPSPGRDANGEGDCLANAAALGEREMEMRWLLHAVMHAVVLALQSGVALAMLSIFALRSTPSFMTTFVLVLCSTTLLVHEIWLLSAVVLLYLQAAILAMTTVSATYMWISCVRENDVLSKGVLIGCGVLFWGTSALAFLRAAVVWKVTSLREDEDLRRRGGMDTGLQQGGRYATF